MSKTATTLHRPGSPRAPRRLLRGLKRIWQTKRTLTNGQIFTAAAILGLAGWLGFGQVEAVKDDQVQAVLDAGLETDYTTARILYERQVTEHASCLATAETRVKTRDDIRGAFLDAALGIRDTLVLVFPDSDDARKFGDAYVVERQTYIDSNYGALDVDVEQGKCVPPGPVPVDPSPAD